MKKKPKQVYCICYLELKYFKTIQQELDQHGYNAKAIIPTINILKKVVKTRSIYQEVPILFNYGFIRMSSEDAYCRNYLKKIQKHINGIRGWVQSPESLHPKKKKRRVDNADIFDDFSMVATATKEEVKRFKRLSRKNHRFSGDDLAISIGEYIILKGYPYDGIDATVLDINYNTKMVKLLLYPENGRMELNLPFDNVINNVYSNFDPDDLLVNRSKDYKLDTLTEDTATKILELKQY